MMTMRILNVVAMTMMMAELPLIMFAHYIAIMNEKMMV